MARLCIHLFGLLRVTLDGAPVAGFESDKVRALLAYLAVEANAPHSREKLAGLLWPERPEAAARSNLRHILANLRRCIGDRHAAPPFLHITRQSIQFNEDSDAWIDVAAFDNLLRTNQATDRRAVQRIEGAVALYGGDFLEGFSLPGSPAFEEWALIERERLQRLALEALQSLSRWYEAGGELERALDRARRQVELAPWQERAHQQVMHLLARTGQRGAALAQYEACRRVLGEELGVAPGEETVRLYEQIRDGEFDILTAMRSAPPVPEPIPEPPAFLVGGDEGAPYQPPVFVAREQELARLDGFLEAALAGQGRVVFVRGGPGRGKTALLDEFARRAMDTHPDLLVASGNCNAYSGVGDPYLPFRDVMGMLSGDVEGRWRAGAIRRDHAARLWEALPETAQALLDYGPHLIPALLRGRPLLSRARAATPQGTPWLERLGEQVERQRGRSEGLEQSHLFQQVSNVLRELAEAHPLLLILDDLQWADSASAGLLFHLGRRLEGSRILVAGAYRPEEVALGRQGERHPLEKVLAEFKRTYGDVWLDLAEGEEREGRHFVDAFLETEPNRLDAGFPEALYRHTGGHPLFTIELLRAMQERGDLRQDEEGRWVVGPSLDWDALPARVEAVIEERIGRLAEELRQILVVASVEGEEFTVQVVARVQEIGERGLLRSLSQELGRRHRLVRGQGVQQAGALRLSRYRFAHALFQQYLYNNLSPGERRLLHGEIAGVLEALYEGQTEVVAVQLARHYGEAGDERRALAYLTLAADGALAAYASGEAESHYRRALDLSRTDSERAHLLEGLGEALFRQGRYEEAIQTWREGIALYESLGNLDGVARLYARSARAAWEGGDPPRGVALCEEGRDAVTGAPESVDQARLLHELGRAQHFDLRDEEALVQCLGALEMAERLGAIEVQADALATLGVLSRHPYQDRLQALTRAIELAEGTELLDVAQRASGNLGFVLMNTSGTPQSARHHFARAAACARRGGNPVQEILHLAYATRNEVRLGDFQRAEANLSRMRHLQSDLISSGRTMFFILHSEAEILRHRGEWLEAVRLLRVCQADARQRGDNLTLNHTNYSLASALVDFCTLTDGSRIGDWAEAERALVESLQVYPGASVTRCVLGVIHARQARFEDAQSELDEARTWAGSAPAPTWKAGFLWVEATLAAAEARWPEALSAYEALNRSHERSGRRWEQARILIDWAAAQAARGDPGDVERARELLRESLAMFEEMGAPGYESAIRDRLRALAAEG